MQFCEFDVSTRSMCFCERWTCLWQFTQFSPNTSISLSLCGLKSSPKTKGHIFITVHTQNLESCTKYHPHAFVDLGSYHSCDNKRRPCQRNVDNIWRDPGSSIMHVEKSHIAESIFRACWCFTSKYFRNSQFLKQPRPFGWHIVWFRVELIRHSAGGPRAVGFILQSGAA